MIKKFVYIYFCYIVSEITACEHFFDFWYTHE